MDLHRSSMARAWRRWRRPPDLTVPPHAPDVESTNRRFLTSGVVPLRSIRSLLRVLLLSPLALLRTLHADQVRCTLRGGRHAQDRKPRPKETPLPARYLAGIGPGAGLGPGHGAGLGTGPGPALGRCAALPHAAELTRCVKAARHRSSP